MGLKHDYLCSTARNLVNPDISGSGNASQVIAWIDGVSAEMCANLCIMDNSCEGFEHRAEGNYSSSNYSTPRYRSNYSSATPGYSSKYSTAITPVCLLWRGPFPSLWSCALSAFSHFKGFLPSHACLKLAPNGQPTISMVAGWLVGWLVG